jgi:hypothetical protein
VPGMTQQSVPVQHYLYGRAGLRPLGDPGKGVVSMVTHVPTALVQCSWRCCSRAPPRDRKHEVAYMVEAVCRGYWSE